ncbi:3-epi-6-deoxocathasterone 23-monooxygenase [Carica papaya]|uniref:3-epi-6-deoxocathasterone 23-monooxygenase n=1 Tax=Carica papaya TaxID=3649 RepID=UPI000B8CB359|nr:3-epi-6-deoxocathasterone 23-monooxygenase [Carica papaya]
MKFWISACWIFLLFVGVWFIWFDRDRRHGRRRNTTTEMKSGVSGVLPEGNLGWPFVGETLDFIASGYTSQPVSFMDKRKSRFGKVFKTHILGTPIIVSTDPDVNKVILQNHGSTFIPAYPKSITELLGKYSILQMNGNLQKKLHALIGGFLRSPQLKSQITDAIEDSVKLALDSWRDMSLVYVQQETRKITFKILVKVLMSIGPGEDLDFLMREFGEFIKGLICLPIKFPGTRLYKSLKAKERLLKMVRRIVEERKLAMEKSQEKGRVEDVLDLLLRENGEGNEKQSLPLDFITDSIIEMMIPGEETVPMAMTLAVKFLSDCPVAIAQLTSDLLFSIGTRALPRGRNTCETESTRGGTQFMWLMHGRLSAVRFGIERLSDEDHLLIAWSCKLRCLSLKLSRIQCQRQRFLLQKSFMFLVILIHDYGWSDYMSLPFTQNVINETLRRANIINGVWRKALKDVEVKGYLIPRGWCVLASFISIHMDIENYENPYKFDPWRWEKIEGAVNNSRFTPFGGGQRLCPGLELSKLEISIFLHHFVTTYRWVAEKDDIIHFPTVKMKRKLPIRVTPVAT